MVLKFSGGTWVPEYTVTNNLLPNDESQSNFCSFHWEDITDIFMLCNDLP